ncbi:unnamed protein product [Rhizoctonia solani]|uniref:NADP-dependent oxidoreductase domain-containing protein n=1 Tax=Rhizoctonia solani TaxID=456999 RepID=A0A8H3I4X9_9AGAM|nr:unnamed protein product [Rhizoctonia solani]
MAQTTTIAGVPIAKIGHGLMSMTCVPEPPSDEQCFESLVAGIDSAPPGVKVFLNAGEFYGTPANINANLDLLNRFFTKYPQGQPLFQSLALLGIVHLCCDATSPAGLERSIKNIIEKLGPNKRLDLFEPARVDPKIPIEETMAILNKYGLDRLDCLNALQPHLNGRARHVGKVAVVEIEVSFWSYEEETREVISKAAEIGAVVAAYSPLGQGVLTGNMNPTQLHKDDYRNHYPRFQEEAFKNNMKLVDALKVIAERKNITPAQLCLAWVSSLGPHVVPIPSSTRATRTLENVSAASIELSEQDLEEIRRAMDLNPVSGDRYSKEIMKTVWG